MVNNHRQYWTRVTRKYDRVVDLQIGGTTRSLIRERVSKEDSLGSMVELGCGTGFNTGALAAKADSLVATDFSPGMLAMTKERIRACNVTFRVEDCQKTSFCDGTFDTAFMSLVIHFTQPPETLAEMRRILKTGGMLIIANLDPAALFAPPAELHRHVDAVLAEAGAAPGHIFNLGHGIWPDTDPDAVARLVDYVHERH